MKKSNYTHINSFVRMKHVNSYMIWIFSFKVSAACYKSKCPYRSSDWIRIMVPENMTSQITLCLALKPHHCIPSIMSVKISWRMNIWYVNIATKHIKLKLDWIDIKLNVKKEPNHLIYNEYNKPSTSNDNDTTASWTIEYPWSHTGNAISSNSIDIIYDKVAFWHKNLFHLPSGLCGKRYIEETTRLLNEWIHRSPLNGISIKAVMLMPSLLLQKPSKKFQVGRSSACIGTPARTMGQRRIWRIILPRRN